MKGGAPKSNHIYRTSQCLFSCFLVLVPGSIPGASAGSACLLASNLICRDGGKYDDINDPQRLSPRFEFKMLLPTRGSSLHHASDITWFQKRRCYNEPGLAIYLSLSRPHKPLRHSWENHIPGGNEHARITLTPAHPAASHASPPAYPNSEPPQSSIPSHHVSSLYNRVILSSAHLFRQKAWARLRRSQLSPSSFSPSLRICAVDPGYCDP